MKILEGEDPSLLGKKFSELVEEADRAVQIRLVRSMTFCVTNLRSAKRASGTDSQGQRLM